MNKLDSVKQHIKDEFKYISTKELQEVLRCFSNIKTLIMKEQDCVNPYLLRNKCVPITNVFEKSFVVKRLRKNIPQEYHEKLNSLLLINGIIKYNTNTPFCVEYFKFLMANKDV